MTPSRMTPNEVRRAWGLPPRGEDPGVPLRRLRFYRHTNDFDGSGYYALRIGRRWLYRYHGKWRFSEYANVIDP